MLGVLDSSTGVLLPPASTAPETAGTAGFYSGVIQLVGKYTIGSEIPASQKLTANGEIGTSDAAFVNSTSLSSITVTRSGNSGTVTLNIPYYWTAQSSDTVKVSFSTFASGAAYAYGFSQTLAVPLPTSGTTTTYDFAVGF